MNDVISEGEGGCPKDDLVGEDACSLKGRGREEKGVT